LSTSYTTEIIRTHFVTTRPVSLSRETQNVIAVITASTNQMGGLALFGYAAFIGGRSDRVFCLFLRQKCIERGA